MQYAMQLNPVEERLNVCAKRGRRRERKKELFSIYERDRWEEQKRVQGWLQELQAESVASLNRRLDDIDDAWPGALPTEEYDRAVGMRIPLGVNWQNREQASHWALDALDGRPALAVDGSQIVPTKCRSAGSSMTAARQRKAAPPAATKKISP